MNGNVIALPASVGATIAASELQGGVAGIAAVCGLLSPASLPPSWSGPSKLASPGDASETDASLASELVPP